jgi:pimeloyl-ACP methyl ester carboxylesterase
LLFGFRSHENAALASGSGMMSSILPGVREMPSLSLRDLGRWRPELPGKDSSVRRAHPLDLAVAVLSRRSKMFARGWGDEAILAELSGKVSREDAPSPVVVTWNSVVENGPVVRRDGTFPSPLDLLPTKTSTVHVRALLKPGNCSACVLLAGSHDEGYRIRERVFGGLPNKGLDLYLVENPFYGLRRTPEGLSAIRVSDQAMLALGMVLEARALLHSLRGQYERLVIAGYSMGGHLAAITAAVSPFEVACAALATGASASSIYTRTLMSWGVDFDGLGGGPAMREMARERLRVFFDAADITRYEPPLRVDAAIILGCTRDGYVLRSETERLHQHWRGSTLHWLSAGHFSALITRRQSLCDRILEALQRL